MDPVKIFYSYAHEDEAYRNELSTYLGILKQNSKIVEWHDRKIKPGNNFNEEISNKIETSDIIIFLISKDFLNSDYCFGVEVEKAFLLHKQGRIEIVPILLKPCLFEESRFSQLQIIPRDAQPISTSTLNEKTFNDVAKEIRDIVKDVSNRKLVKEVIVKDINAYPEYLNIVRQQVSAYAQLYERIRQLMPPGYERTNKMQAIFEKMKLLATSSYHFLEEFSKSPLPGERLAAISILLNYSSESYFKFLAETIGAEKPFVGYQAAIALRFAVSAVTQKSYNSLLESIILAKEKLAAAEYGFDSDRYSELNYAEQELNYNIKISNNSSN